MRVDGDSLEGASLPIGRGMLVSIVMDLEFSMVEPRASSILPGPGVLLIRQTRSLKVNLVIIIIFLMLGYRLVLILPLVQPVILVLEPTILL
jgi:hypothetical protein